MRRVLVSIVMVVLCFLLQTSVFDTVRLAGITPNILIVLICSTAVMRGQKAGMLTGFFSGLLLDIFFGKYLGAFAFLYMIFGFVDGFFHRLYYSDDNVLPLILIGCNDLVYGLIMYIVTGLLHRHLHFLFYLRSVILPELVYTVAVGIVLYRVLLRIDDRLSRTEQGSADFV